MHFTSQLHVTYCCAHRTSWKSGLFNRSSWLPTGASLCSSTATAHLPCQIRNQLPYRTEHPFVKLQAVRVKGHGVEGARPPAETIPVQLSLLSLLLNDSVMPVTGLNCSSNLFFRSADGYCLSGAALILYNQAHLCHLWVEIAEAIYGMTPVCQLCMNSSPSQLGKSHRQTQLT